MRFSKIEARSENAVQQDLLWLFDLADIFPGYKRLVNISYLIVSLLPVDQSGYVIAQRLLTESEMRVLLPLLENPMCWKPEVLQASCICSYEFLLKSMHSPNGKVSAQWNEGVLAQRDRLRLASEQKAKRTEMRGVYNALFGLRQKLEPLGLTVRSRRDGYYLCKVGA